jgi:hypothetical protein
MLDHFDLSDDDHEDAVNARSVIYRIICLTEGIPIPETGALVEVSVKPMTEICAKLIRDAAALVEQHWAAINRVAKHLERHSVIDTLPQT